MFDSSSTISCYPHWHATNHRNTATIHVESALRSISLSLTLGLFTSSGKWSVYSGEYYTPFILHVVAFRRSSDYGRSSRKIRPTA